MPPYRARQRFQVASLQRGGDRRGVQRRLRDKVDLDTLSAELLAVVDQTMQPTAASLWLRPSAQTPARTKG
jgi:hypothetical protein